MFLFVSIFKVLLSSSDGANLGSLKEGVIRLFQTHVQSLFRRQEVTAADIQNGFVVERKYYEKGVAGAQNSIAKCSQLSRKDNERAIRDNVALIQQCNDLRKEIKITRQLQKAKV